MRAYCCPNGRSVNEPLEYALRLAGQVDWVWIDCFTHLPLDEYNYKKLKEHFKICIVSPELQSHPLEYIQDFSKQISNLKIDAVCTKRPDLWKKY